MVGFLGPLLGGAFQLFGQSRAQNAMEDANQLAYDRRVGHGQEAFRQERQGFRRAGQAQVRGARRAGNALERASRRAGQAGITAANDQLDLAGDVLGQQRDLFADPLEAGTNALGAYAYETGTGARPSGYAGFTGTPGYDFRLNEGYDAITGNAAATGSSLSGAAAKALTRYGQDYASNEYGAHMDRLGNLVSVGEGARGAVGNALANYGGAASGAIGARGAAQTAMHTGVGAARAGTAANIADARAAMHTSIGGAGARSQYYMGEAGGQAAENQGNIAGAGWMGLGNALSGTLENLYGVNAATGYGQTPAYGVNTQALRGAVGNSNMNPGYQNPWAIW